MIKKFVVTAFCLAFTLACFGTARAALDACEDVCNEEASCSTGCSEYRRWDNSYNGTIFSYSEVATTCGAGGYECKSEPEEENEGLSSSNCGDPYWYCSGTGYLYFVVPEDMDGDGYCTETWYGSGGC